MLRHRRVRGDHAKSGVQQTGTPSAAQTFSIDDDGTPTASEDCQETANEESGSSSSLDRSRSTQAKARKTVTRRELVCAIAARREGVSQREVRLLLDGLIEEMKAALVVGHTVKLRNFGSFSPRAKSGWVRHDSRSGKITRVQPRTVVVFKSSPCLRAAVNAAEPTEREDVPSLSES
jgi:integration host factor subunit alpha